MRILIPAIALVLASACDGGSEGDSIYSVQCATCHGADGTGTSLGADLTAQAPGLSEDDIADIVLNGTGNMLAIEMTEAEAADVAGYVFDTYGDGM